MMAALPASARRRGPAGCFALLCGLVALLAAGGSARAAATPARGQIVWSASNGIWAMNDDGTGPHELLSAASPPLATLLPSGTLSAPDVFQAGGKAVVFLGSTSAFSGPSLPAACGADCTGTFELHNGVLTELGPAAAPAVGAAYYETQPRITADGQELFDSALYTGIVAGSVGAPATALVERPLAQHATVTQWSNTNAEGEPPSGFDPAPDPVDPTMAVWVEAQGCAHFYPNAQNVQQSSCQYAVHFGTASNLADPVVIYDNEFVAANGRGPTSLDLSADGSTLLLVDASAPNTGIYTTAVAGVPGLKPVTEVVAQPAGWTFGQARFAGSKIVFDAHQQVNGKATGDIYTIPASCSIANGCTFPASATDLTNNPTADNSNPAWTSATTALAPLHVAVRPRIMSATAPTSPVRAGRRFTLVVTLSAPATIVVKIVRRMNTAPRSRTVGSISSAGRAGKNRLSIGLVAGRALPAGSYTATVALRGSSTATRTVHFSVTA
jgi:hypothetical protein